MSCSWCILLSDLLRSRFFDDVLGPVVECGNGLVSPRYISNALLRCVNRIYRFFGWGSLPFGAFASGAIVVWAEPELGRGLASKMPFSLQLLGRLQFFYVILDLKLSMINQLCWISKRGFISTHIFLIDESIKNKLRFSGCK
jgi:hypothetical protein